MSKKEFLTILGEVLGRCAILGLALVLIWFGLSVLPGQLLCGLQGGLFGLTPHECALVNYVGIAALKIAVLTLFVFPWIAIQLTLRQPRR